MRKLAFTALPLLCLCLVAVSPASAAQPLKLGIHPYLSATEIARRFKPLADYLGRELKTPVTIEIAASYREHIRNVGTGAVDIGFMGPASYVLLVDQYGTRPLLAAFESDGKRTFRGVIVAQRDSPLATLADLKGKRFAFGDPESTMSHFVPRQMLLRQGVSVSALAEHQFLTNHDNIALGVLSGGFDAGALKEDVFRQYEREGLKAIAFSEEFGDHVFVASGTLPPETAAVIRRALLGLKGQPGGGAILAGIQKSLTALVPATDREYDNLRAVLQELRGAGVEP